MGVGLLAVNVGGMAQARVQAAVAQHPGLDIYGFMETWAGVDTCSALEQAAGLASYRAWHAVRPVPSVGRPHGGVSVFVRESFVRQHGCSARCDEDTGIVWLAVPGLRLTIAVCYFSPATSQVYARGFLRADPVPALLDGLHAANAKGHRFVVLGDLNVRIGCMREDVPAAQVLPPFLAHSALAEHPDLAGIPGQRDSADARVPDPEAAKSLLQGLFAAKGVVLNGRAPAPAARAGRAHRPGNAGLTCCARRGTGGSVVDLAMCSRSLYGQVASLEVCPFLPELSADHHALVLHLACAGGDGPAQQRQRQRRLVYRPSPLAYAMVLEGLAPRFEELLQSWQLHGTPAAEAHDQFVRLVQQAAVAAGGARPMGQGGGRPRGDQPWFDAECRAAQAALRQACQAQAAAVQTGVSDQAVQAQLGAARAAYKRVVRAKKQEHLMKQQLSLLETYFSPHQQDYWTVFFGRRHTASPVADVSQWTAWFAQLLGTTPSPLPLDAAQAAAKRALYAQLRRDRRVCDADDLGVLNAPLSVSEVADAMLLPGRKAADLQGLTGEAVKVAAEVPRGQNGFTCPPFVACVQWVLQRVFDGDSLPAAMTVSKVTPVPKSCQPAAPAVLSNYRGICVSSVLSKVWDRVLFRRLDALAELKGMRAPTQCGFRRGYGTLDAIFTLQHLIDKYRARNRRLYVVFVDFKQAFDLVRRDLLLERCRELGMQGPFLAALEALYDRVLLQVSVAGEQGQPFRSHAGTKQGSVLSPLLFGLFVELLHDMLRQHAAGVGPVLAGLQVPDILYADDGALAAESPEGCQALLDVLALFCRLFGMRVNLAPSKTCAVVFRRPRQGSPAIHLLFEGQAVPVQDTYTYLGVCVHATRGLRDAPAALASSGGRAMHAMLGRLRGTGLSQFDIRCRMFDVLVEPVMSYASHVWGPNLFADGIRKGDHVSSAADRTHLYFPRMRTGVGPRVCTTVLLRDTHRSPVSHHWVVLAARWWSALAAMDPGVPRLARSAWLSDITLMRGSETGGRVYTQCWSYKLLSALQDLGVISAAAWGPSVDLTQLRFDEACVRRCLSRRLNRAWQRVVRQPDGTAVPVVQQDPRAAVSDGVLQCTHAAHVYAFDGSADYTQRQDAPPHMRLCMPSKYLQCLAQLRLGAARLEVQLGRRQRQRVPRAERVCRLCQPACVEDERHFLLECPAYDGIRAQFGLLPRQPAADPGACMRQFFAHANQSAAARMVFAMRARRASLLGTPFFHAHA